MALGFALLTETPKPRRVWLRIVGDNERRINDESLRYRYVCTIRNFGRSGQEVHGILKARMCRWGWDAIHRLIMTCRRVSGSLP